MAFIQIRLTLHLQHQKWKVREEAEAIQNSSETRGAATPNSLLDLFTGRYGSREAIKQNLWDQLPLMSQLNLLHCGAPDEQTFCMHQMLTKTIAKWLV